MDLSPSYYASGFPKSMREAYQAWHQEHDPVPGQEPALEGIICFLGRGEAALLGFLPDGSHAKAVVEDAVFGHHAALACHMANESYFRKSAVYYDPASKSIKS